MQENKSLLFKIKIKNIFEYPKLKEFLYKIYKEQDYIMSQYIKKHIEKRNIFRVSCNNVDLKSKKKIEENFNKIVIESMSKINLRNKSRSERKIIDRKISDCRMKLKESFITKDSIDNISNISFYNIKNNESVDIKKKLMETYRKIDPKKQSDKSIANLTTNITRCKSLKFFNSCINKKLDFSASNATDFGNFKEVKDKNKLISDSKTFEKKYQKNIKKEEKLNENINRSSFLSGVKPRIVKDKNTVSERIATSAVKWGKFRENKSHYSTGKFLLPFVSK